MKIFGPGVTIFGKGADGGREATYQGKSSYEKNGQVWDGYTVFQAKFRQRLSSDTKENGDWAIEQLTKELKWYANPKKKRKSPDYYIFATNVVLTPVQHTGSKDRIAKKIDEYRDLVAIQDYDIWDYDKICRLLDDNADIRAAYAGFITPGDVLTKINQYFDFEVPDFDRTISNFL